MKEFEEMLRKNGWKLREEIAYSNGIYYSNWEKDGEIVHIEYDTFPDELIEVVGEEVE